MSSAVIIFCGECGTKIVTDKKHAGRAAVCAECKAKVPIPRSPGGKPQLRLFCPGCKNRVAATLARAGHTMKCPKCDEEIELPRVRIGDKPPKKKRGEWMPKGTKKAGRRQRPPDDDEEIVPLEAAGDKEEDEEEEDEILSLLKRMTGMEKRSDTEPVDVVEVIDDDDEADEPRKEPPKVIDEELQRAETQGMEPVEQKRKHPAKKAAKESPKKGTFRFMCPECGFRILVKESDIGRKGRCPDCKEIVVIEK